MKIVVEGCAHGELEKIYESVENVEKQIGSKVDLLLCCGDFQATRNMKDLDSMAVPKKYQDLCTFYKYYSGEKVAPVLTIFIGGNHEASNHLQELPYGGWAAPNIYYMGYAGVITVGGIRIAGVSGIYKGRDYLKGHYEAPPYNEDTKRSVYHVRNLEIYRLKQMSSPIDVIISHDWPKGIHNFGHTNQLLKNKPFFKEDIASDSLGSDPCWELLDTLKPSYWFAAHLHTKFAALVPHNDDSDKDNEKQDVKYTRFLALDKCLPKRKFLQLVEIPHDTNIPIELCYDLEWLTILFLTNHLLSVKRGMQYMPGPGSDQRWKYTPTEEEMSAIMNRMKEKLKVPENFTRTVPAHPQNGGSSRRPNPQTTELCSKLGIDDPFALLCSPSMTSSQSNIAGSDGEEPYSDEEHETSEDLTFFQSMESVQSTESGTPSKINMSSLSLPPPKFTEDEDADVLIDSSKSLTESIDSGTPDKGGTVEQSTEEGGESGQEVKPLRQLKRRNQALYQSTEDSE